MRRRPYDTSRAKCDTCGKLYKDGDAVYSVADRYDEDIEDRDVLVSFRHYSCHVPVSVALDDLTKKLKDAEKILDQLRKLTR